MSKQILIDGDHPEETRVAIVESNRIQAYDYESPDHKPLRGNIYLAKVMRVEPSLQAAFVDFGGNRHGFLAFSEIHPDYFQIPHADKQALIEEAAREARRQAEDEDADDDLDPDGDISDPSAPASQCDENSPDQTLESGQGEDNLSGEEGDGNSPPLDDSDESFSQVEAVDEPRDEDKPKPRGGRLRNLWRRPGFTRALRNPEESRDSAPVNEAGEQPTPQANTSEDRLSYPSDDTKAADADIDFESPSEVDSPDQEQAKASDSDSDANYPNRRPSSRGRRRPGDRRGNRSRQGERRATRQDGLGGSRWLTERYRIQEVIKRGQVLLIQVVKEERGNKGAALTTYLSLAGRYSVLMPNTARGCGISRKIIRPQDRRRLKEIAEDLRVPQGMGVILRTAGASRTKKDIQQDFEYLALLWDKVRSLTMESVAPALVYEEGSLIKRTMRDGFDKSFDRVVVSGRKAYEEARDMLELLDPELADHVKFYNRRAPILTHYNIERQIEAMYSPIVQLPSGGYIVINQTEALVAIDINSGKATREHNIEDMALSTNLEAAEEICRQLRLRDLAGLIVIDFIDMDERRNNRSVEWRLREALKQDRARTQVGTISNFGLLEMSRQRQRTGFTEGSSMVCPTCRGSGLTRSPNSLALQVLRNASTYFDTHRPRDLLIKTRPDIAMNILNNFRHSLSELEAKAGVAIQIGIDHNLEPDRLFAIEKLNDYTPRPNRHSLPEEGDDSEDRDRADDVSSSEVKPARDDNHSTGKDRNSRRRGRRGRGRSRDTNRQDTSAETNAESEQDGIANEQSGSPTLVQDAGDKASAPSERDQKKPDTSEAPIATNETLTDGNAQPKSRAKSRRPSRTKTKAAGEDATTDQTADSAPTSDENKTSEEKKPTRRRKKSASAATLANDPKAADDGDVVASTKTSDDPKTSEKPKRIRKTRTAATASSSDESEKDADTSDKSDKTERKSKPRRAAKSKTSAETSSGVETTTKAAPVAIDIKTESAPKSSEPARKGWWQKGS